MNKDKPHVAAPQSEAGYVRVFEVDSHGTLFEADFVEPKTRLDAFDLRSDFFASADSVLVEMEHCEPLSWKVVWMYDDNHREQPADREETAREWLVQMTPEEFAVAIRMPLERWAHEAPDWCQEDEHIPTAQGAAMRYFENEPEMCDLLGVEIVEGEHPGSSFYAAVLEGDVDSANEAARKAGLAIRFVREGSTLRE